MPDATQNASSPPRGGPGPAPAPRTRFAQRRIRVAVVATMLLAIGGGAYWYANRDLESTDDAFVDGTIIHISPRVPGTVLALHVTDNQVVRRGDPLLTLDPRDYELAVERAEAALANAMALATMTRANLALVTTTSAASVEQAQAGIASARATLSQAQAQMAAVDAEAARARADLARYERLVGTDFTSRQRYDQAQADARGSAARLQAALQGVKAAEGQLDQALGRLNEAMGRPEQMAARRAEAEAAEAQARGARAALEQARLNLSYTKITAPEDGVVTRRRGNAGDQVDRTHNLIALVGDALWITANFKETQLTRMRPGQTATIRIDAYPDMPLKGHVDSIQRGTGARFALLPPENATGNHIKVVQRVPVKIVLDQPPPAGLVLGLGLSVVPTVDIGSR